MAKRIRILSLNHFYGNAEICTEDSYIGHIISIEELNALLASGEFIDIDATEVLAVEKQDVEVQKFAVQIKPDRPPIRVDASSIEKAREIAERVFGSIHDIYRLFDWVQSPAAFAENAG